MVDIPKRLYDLQIILTAILGACMAEWWNWKVIREHYEQRLAVSPRTQADVAHAGGFKGGEKSQNAISKLLRNHKLGPTVETFLKAVNGLGMTPSQFFAELERDSPPSDVPLASLPPAATTGRDVADLQRAREIIRLARRLSTLIGVSDDPPGPERQRDAGGWPRKKR